MSEDHEVEVSDGDTRAVDGASLSSLPGSARGGVWECGLLALAGAVPGAHLLQQTRAVCKTARAVNSAAKQASFCFSVF